MRTVVVRLVCEIPSEYPTVVPKLDLEIVKGLGKKHCDDILEIANKTVLHALSQIFLIQRQTRFQF